MKGKNATNRRSPSNLSPRQLGKSGETAAVRYLQRRGYQIAAQGFRAQRGEIDIIAYDGQILVFIEVKTRRTRQFGAPEEAVTHAKQKQIRRLAAVYCTLHNLEDTPCRFDVLSLQFVPDKDWEITQFKNAFE